MTPYEESVRAAAFLRTRRWYDPQKEADYIDFLMHLDDSYTPTDKAVLLCHAQ